MAGTGNLLRTCGVTYLVNNPGTQARGPASFDTRISTRILLSRLCHKSPEPEMKKGRSAHHRPPCEDCGGGAEAIPGRDNDGNKVSAAVGEGRAKPMRRANPVRPSVRSRPRRMGPMTMTLVPCRHFSLTALLDSTCRSSKATSPPRLPLSSARRVLRTTSNAATATNPTRTPLNSTRQVIQATSKLQGYCYCYESAPALAGRGSATSATYGCYYGSTDAGYDRDYCRPPDLERPRRAALGGASPLVLHTQD